MDRTGQAQSDAVKRLIEAHRLVAPGAILPIQFDRQTDKIITPLPTAAGSSAVGPFSIIDASTGGGSPAAKIQVAYGVFMSPSLGTNIDVTMGGTPLGSGPTLTLGSAGTYKIYLSTDLSSSCAVNSTTGAVPSDAPGTPATYLILGLVTVVAVTGGFKVSQIQQAVNTSLSAVLCTATNNFMWSGI